MKKLTLILSLLISTLIINAQEIIKAKSTFSIPIKPVTFSNPSGIDSNIIDSLELSGNYSGVSGLDSITKPIHLIKSKEGYYKINFEQLSKSFNLNFIKSIDFIKKEDDLKKFGSFAKNGVMIINFENGKVNDILNFSKMMKFELIK